MKKVEHLIKEVYPGSIAEELEIEPGDVLLSINDQSIEDVFDYRYMIKDEYIEVLVNRMEKNGFWKSTRITMTILVSNSRIS